MDRRGQLQGGGRGADRCHTTGVGGGGVAGWLWVLAGDRAQLGGRRRVRPAETVDSCQAVGRAGVQLRDRLGPGLRPGVSDAAQMWGTWEGRAAGPLPSLASP